MRPHILMIENESDWVNLFERVLSRDYEVTTVRGLTQASQVLEQQKFDLVLVYLNLTESWPMQGFLSHLHQQYSRLPVIAYTDNKLKYSEVFELGKLGVVDFIHKSESSLEVFQQRIRFALKGSPSLSKQPKSTVPMSMTILFLIADPSDATRLRLGEELREIQEKLQLAKLREQFELHQRMSVRPADISQALLDIQPQIVHFSGHGTATGALCFENQAGEIHPIQPDALAVLFEQFASQVNCVVLNACYSETQANAIAKHIDCVIGMNQAIGDRAAIAFAIGFYQALGAGLTVEEAYKLGCVQIRLQNISEHLTPVLKSFGLKILKVLSQSGSGGRTKKGIRDDTGLDNTVVTDRLNVLKKNDYVSVERTNGERWAITASGKKLLKDTSRVSSDLNQ